jgi:DNA polymerase III delta subunit
MNVFLIHGDYVSKSHDRLLKYIEKAKEKKWDIEYFGKDLNKNLAELLSSQNLFGNEKLVVCESFREIKPVDLKWLNKNGGNLNGNLLIYADTILNDGDVKNIPFLKKTEEYKLPKVIFDFMSSFYPGNSLNCLKYLKAVTETEPPEFVFSLLSKQLRDLYWVKVNASNIPYPSWRVEKLERQANRFTIAELKQTINQFSHMDIKAKTSDDSIMNLLDLFIATKLE